ncbi:MAG: heme ABC exporter ATP-binding protein CcmA [Gammaproteobacteria bacterium]
MPGERPAEVLLTVRGLAAVRDGRTLFAGLDFDLRAGAGLELTGPNGSGKSTLLRIVAGLQPDHDGSVSAVEHLYLGHRPGISSLLTVAENLAWFAALQPAASASARQPVSERVRSALDRVGLPGFDDIPCARLSAGQQRRVALARLVLGGAPLWLLDEPLTALDDAGHRLVRALLAAHLRAGGAAIWATHQSLALVGVIPGVMTLALGQSDGPDGSWRTAPDDAGAGTANAEPGA